MKKTNYILFVLSGILCVLLILFPQNAGESVKNALEMCVGSLIPSLFPFMVLGNLLVNCGGGEVLGKRLAAPLKRVFGLGGACSLPIVVGLISGFPVGAVVTAELVKKGEITCDEGERVLCLCNNPGPFFVLTAVAEMLACGRIGGLVLWISLTLSAFAGGLIFSRGTPSFGKTAPHLPESGAECVVNAVKNGIIAMLNVCGFVTFFGVTVNIISLPMGELPGVVAGGIAEVATGCFGLSALSINETAKIPFAAMLLGWSGLSVHAQVAAAVQGSGIRLKRYMSAKLMQMLTAPCIAMFLMKLIPLETPVSAITKTHPSVIVFVWTFEVIAMLFGLVIIAFSGKKAQAEV